MSKIMFLGNTGSLMGGVFTRPRARPRPRRRAGFGRGDMSTADKVKAILAGIVIGLMLAAPVAALVAVAGNNDPGVFHDLSPWSFGVPR